MKILSLCLPLFLAACASTPSAPEEGDWGPQPGYRPPDPLVLPARDAPLARRRRVYLLKRLSLDEEGPVVGFQRCQWSDLSEFLKLSGAGDQAAKLQGIRRSKEAWRLAADLSGMAAFFQELGLPRSNAIRGEANRRAGMILETEHLAAARRQMGLYNRRLAAALGLSGAGDPGIQLPPPFTTLDLFDLVPGESWEDWIPAYTLSRRDRRWRLGDLLVPEPKLAAFLASCGYDKAAEAIHASSRPWEATAVEHAAAQYNGFVPTRLRLRAEECARIREPQASKRP